MNYKEYIEKLTMELENIGLTTDFVKNFNIFKSKLDNIEKLLQPSIKSPDTFIFDKNIVEKIIDFYDLYHKYSDCLYNFDFDIINNEILIKEMNNILKKYLTSHQHEWLEIYLFERDKDGEVKIWDADDNKFVINSPEALIEYLNKK